MTWTRYIPATPSRADRVTLRVTATGYERPHLVIRIARAIAARAGLPADSKSRIDVYFGEGAHAGQMKIVHAPGGTYACHPQGRVGALKISFPAPPGLPHEWPAGEAAWTAEDDGLAFHLPWHRRPAEREVEDLSPPPPREAAAAGNAMAAAAAAVERPADAAVNGTVRHHVYADSGDGETRLTFEYGGRSVELPLRLHGLATALHKAMGRGFVPYDHLMTVARNGRLDILQANISALRRRIEPLGLEIATWPKAGYFMRAREGG